MTGHVKKRATSTTANNVSKGIRCNYNANFKSVVIKHAKQTKKQTEKQQQKMQCLQDKCLKVEATETKT